jgi:hypothetical protein
MAQFFTILDDFAEIKHYLNKILTYWGATDYYGAWKKNIFIPFGMSPSAQT